MWSHDNIDLSNDSQITIYEELVVVGGLTFVKSILEICSISAPDGGEYHCTASNQNGTHTANFNLTVLSKGMSEFTLFALVALHYHTVVKR